jgi:hypothetical protein
LITCAVWRSEAENSAPSLAECKRLTLEPFCLAHVSQGLSHVILNLGIIGLICISFPLIGANCGQGTGCHPCR